MRRDEGWKSQEHGCVCRVHLKTEDFDRTGQTVRL